MIVWFTGIPAAGKTTLGLAVADTLGLAFIDSETVRERWDDQDFSRLGRQRAALRAWTLASEQPQAAVACISPYDEDRKAVRVLTESRGRHFLLVHCDCPEIVAHMRDPKGLYAKARERRQRGVTGLSGEYQRPDDALVLRTDKLTVEQCVGSVVAQINRLLARKEVC
jgi:adenylylsulfate kinase